jgi:hypothetical protein
MLRFRMLDLSCVQAMCWSGRVGTLPGIGLACYWVLSRYILMASEREEEKLETSNIMYDNATQQCDTCFGTVWRSTFHSVP